MDRHQFTTEDHDGLVAELTAQRVRSWVLLLQAGDQRATNDLHNLVLDRLAEDDAKALFVKAITDPDYAGPLFADIVMKLMHDQCVAAAENTVDAMEKGRQQSADENRIDMAEQAKALH
jgi:hypothetical protein